MQHIIQKLVYEEIFAAMFYEVAANMLLCKGFKSESKTYREIAREELEHIQELTELAYKFGFQLDFDNIDRRIISTDFWKTMKDIVIFAINLEQEAINSYNSALKSVENNKELTEVLSHILKEEQEHKTDFTEIYEDLLDGSIEDLKASIVPGVTNVTNKIAQLLKYYSF